MKRILVSEGGEREIDVARPGPELHEVETGTALVLDDGVVHRVTHTGGRLLVNGKEVRLELADPRDRRRNGGRGADGGRKEIRAAMPGKVVRVLVAAGDEVEAGMGLLILEAMKMQNEVKSPGSGRVAAVAVGVGETVASGQTLVTLE